MSKDSLPLNCNQSFWEVWYINWPNLISNLPHYLEHWQNHVSKSTRGCREGIIKGKTLIYGAPREFLWPGLVTIGSTLRYFASLNSSVLFEISFVYVKWRALSGSESSGYRVIVIQLDLVYCVVLVTPNMTQFSRLTQFLKVELLQI